MRLPNLLLFLLLATVAAAAENLHWESDLATARARAAAENKQLLIDFTGTSWCPPCIALHDEVMGTPQFKAWVADKVLLALDYPARNERTPEKVAANPALAKLIAIRDEFEIRGFPTLVLLSADGRELTRVVGYSKGMGAKAYLAEFGTAGPP